MSREEESSSSGAARNAPEKRGNQIGFKLSKGKEKKKVPFPIYDSFRGITKKTPGIFIDNTYSMSRLLKMDDRLIVVCGPPCSGKSIMVQEIASYVRDWAHYSADNPPNVFEAPDEFGARAIDDESDDSFEAAWHQKHDVIRLSLSRVSGTNEAALLSSIRGKLANMYREHCYLENELNRGDKEMFNMFLERRAGIGDLPSAISFLAELLSKHNKRKPVVLVDDADYPITSLMRPCGPIGHKMRVIRLYRDFLSNSFVVRNEAAKWHKAILFGVLPFPIVLPLSRVPHRVFTIFDTPIPPAVDAGYLPFVLEPLGMLDLSELLGKQFGGIISFCDGERREQLAFYPLLRAIQKVVAVGENSTMEAKVEAVQKMGWVYIEQSSSICKLLSYLIYHRSYFNEISKLLVAFKKDDDLQLPTLDLRLNVVEEDYLILAGVAEKRQHRKLNLGKIHNPSIGRSQNLKLSRSSEDKYGQLFLALATYYNLLVPHKLDRVGNIATIRIPNEYIYNELKAMVRKVAYDICPTMCDEMMKFLHQLYDPTWVGEGVEDAMGKTKSFTDSVCLWLDQAIREDILALDRATEQTISVLFWLVCMDDHDPDCNTIERLAVEEGMDEVDDKREDETARGYLNVVFKKGTLGRGLIIEFLFGGTSEDFAKHWRKLLRYNTFEDKPEVKQVTRILVEMERSSTNRAVLNAVDCMVTSTPVVIGQALYNELRDLENVRDRPDVYRSRTTPAEARGRSITTSTPQRDQGGKRPRRSGNAPIQTEYIGCSNGTRRGGWSGRRVS